VVGPTVPVAVLCVPVRVLPVPGVWGPWRLGAPHTVGVVSRDVGEALGEGTSYGHVKKILRGLYTEIS